MKLKKLSLITFVILFGVLALCSVQEYIWDFDNDKLPDRVVEVVKNIKSENREWLYEYVSQKPYDLGYRYPHLLANLYLYFTSPDFSAQIDIIDNILSNDFIPADAAGLLFEGISPEIVIRKNYLNVIWLERLRETIDDSTPKEEIPLDDLNRLVNVINSDLMISMLVLSGRENHVSPLLSNRINKGQLPFDDVSLRRLGLILNKFVKTNNSLINESINPLVALYSDINRIHEIPRTSLAEVSLEPHLSALDFNIADIVHEFAQKNQSASHPNRNHESARWTKFFSQFDRLVRNSIRFSSVEVFSAFDGDGVVTIMTKEDGAYWADFENKSFQDFSKNSFRHSSWGTGRSGGSFFNHSEEGILLSLNHQIGSFDFENLNLNRKPFSTERSPRVNIRRHPRQSHSPINLIMYNGFGSPIWKRDFHLATDLNETQNPRFYDESRTHFFEMNPETQLPALIGQFMRDEDGNALGLQRIIELEDFLVVDGYSLPTQIRVTFFDLDSNRPTHQTEYFIRPNTVEIGPDVQPLFQRDSLIPIGASVNNHIANISYIHSETLGWGEKNAQELK